MSNMYVTEYLGFAQGGEGAVAAPGGPSVAEQKITISATAASSAAFNASTKAIRVHVDGITSVSVGPSPTATLSSARMVAGQTEYYAVEGGWTISGITNT